MQDEFYIGYLKKAPEYLARFLRSTAGTVVVATLFIAALAALGQHLLPGGTYEFGVTTTIQGKVVTEPVPHLIVASTEHPAMKAGTSAILVGEGKHGVSPELLAMDSAQADVEASVISKGDTVMLEVQSFTQSPGTVAPAPGAADAGEVTTLEGELVDTKCFLGVMRPGRGKVHRGCAIACLEGGVPAGLWVRESEADEGKVIFIANDAAYHDKVKPEWAGLRLRITGTLRDLDGIPTLQVLEVTPL